jgi:dTDP-4-amino-4,6-dideoxygalactose transaminase
LDEIQAAFLSIKLKKLDTDNEYRREIAKLYISGIKNHKLKLPNFEEVNLENVFHIFPIRCENRDKLIDYLTQNHIQTVIHYPIPPHKQKAFTEWNHLSYPITEKIHSEIISIPISPILTEKEVDKIIITLNSY